MKFLLVGDSAQLDKHCNQAEFNLILSEAKIKAQIKAVINANKHADLMDDADESWKVI